MERETPDSGKPETFDDIAAELQALREQAGPVSYAEIARRISEQRLAKGINEAAAMPPRSTVYNAFRQGRARLDTELIREIVVALGADEAAADHWVDRCRCAQRGEIEPKPVLETGPLAVVSAKLRVSSGVYLLVLLICVAVNMLGNAIIRLLGLPVFLDMVGTAVAAVAFGPWSGAIVAVITNLLGAFVGDHDYFFMLVGVAGALVWGYGVRVFRMGDTFARFLSLGLIVALVCSVIATPLLMLNHNGGFGAGQINVTAVALTKGMPLVVTVFTVNIITSVIDKLFTSYVALAALPVLHQRLGVPIAQVPLVARLFPPKQAGPDDTDSGAA